LAPEVVVQHRKLQIGVYLLPLLLHFVVNLAADMLVRLDYQLAAGVLPDRFVPIHERVCCQLQEHYSYWHTHQDDGKTLRNLFLADFGDKDAN